ncbi:sterol desaturase/sphingolipid hydroxylase (fatty acid hydroxylase superfamily) [Bacillus thermophilus]|uniref:Sterol desaturase/sphingolipid hydroxylase (Fatty acid hydroxylase superfamily) n=1 Tax=Siminovitchia thermophila TaxID=1245522 RepID=A0ABS2REH9_9BACI|nr:sterol desaturase family protein [Siminovitchia thermophila]MBM7717604.1 sterol desaturase/sphingolipid hydroxylase (fatty acid hydroxylase superfamily) [Siminovitchia thermophila]
MKRKFLKEYFLYPDIFVMTVLWIISVGFMMPHVGSLWTWLAFVLGMIAYTLVEYMTHRFLFHMNPPKNPFLLHLLKRLHYDHHVNPNELHLLFLPLWYTLPNLLIAGIIAYLVTSSLALTNSFLAGVVLFLLFYEWKHYIAHRPIKPISPWGRWMKKMHLWHHFKNENYWYGVTNPVYDWAMGTFKEQQNVKRSESVRNLEQRKANHD